MRDMILTAENMKRIKFDENGHPCYDMTISEIKQLAAIGKDGTWDDICNAVITAFRYGFALGNKAVEISGGT